jgi:hypothetical protein
MRHAMTCPTTADSHERPRAVPFPCGPARQYRVQTLASPSDGWKKFATYNRRETAQRCLARLAADGYQARVVDYRYCPTAG